MQALQQSKKAGLIFQWRALGLIIWGLLVGREALAVPGSASFGAGQYGSVNISGSTYTSRGSWRLEGRVTSWALPANGSRYNLVSLVSANVNVALTNSGGVPQLYFFDFIDGILDNGFVIPVPNITGGDFVWRLTKNSAASTMTLEAWNVNGSGYSAKSATLGQAGAVNNALTGVLRIGDPALAAGSIAFVRWFSTLVPIASQAPYGAGVGADLGDWEFNGNGNDSSSHGDNLAYTGGAPSYPTAPIYPPACILPPQTTFRAGVPLTTLNASGAFPLDGSTSLTRYLWQQISEPSPFTGQDPPTSASWVGETLANPVLTGLISGSYTIQLTVTQGNGQSSSCSQKYGMVATDDNGSVVIPNPVHAKILGPMMITNKNPWPAYEAAGTQFAQAMIQKLAGTNEFAFQFLDFWNYPLQGTITVTPNSTTVVGSGTHFLAQFCNGSAGPSIQPNIQNPYIVVWYPIGGSLYPSSVFGRWLGSVASCTDDTHITLTSVYPFSGSSSPDPFINAGSGLNWSYADTSFNTLVTTLSTAITATGSQAVAPASVGQNGGNQNCSSGQWIGLDTGSNFEFLPATANSSTTITIAPAKTHAAGVPMICGFGGIGGWQFGAYPGNYYDNVVAFYAQYYRTGLDDYLNAARLLADRWFSYPGVSLGVPFGSLFIQNHGGQIPYRSLAMMGLFMRNADNPPFSYWPGLRQMVNYLIASPGSVPQSCNLVGPTSTTCGGGFTDTRESSYALGDVALDVLFDPSPTQVATSAAAVSRDMNNRWDPWQQSNGTWYMCGDVTGYSSWINSFTASVSVGSSTVTAQSGQTWSQGNFVAPPFGPGNIPSSIWFNPNGTTVPEPASSFGAATSGDTAWYYVKYINSTTLQLIDVNGNPVNYTSNVSCTSSCSGLGWSVSGLLGCGVQPFMVGINSWAFWTVSQALATTNPSTGTAWDAVNANKAASFTLANATWTATTGVDFNTYTAGSSGSATVNGLYYGRGFVSCEPPTYSTANPMCDNNAFFDPNGSFQQGRFLNGEGVNIATKAAILNPGSNLVKLLGDTLMGAMFGTPGTPGGDNYNIASNLTTNYISFTSAHKWWGYFWGIGAGWSWPSARLGGLTPPIPRVIQQELNFGAATQALLTITRPDGETSQVTCTSSPCAVSIDARQGDHLIQVQYLDGTGRVLRSSRFPLKR